MGCMAYADDIAIMTPSKRGIKIVVLMRRVRCEFW